GACPRGSNRGLQPDVGGALRAHPRSAPHRHRHRMDPGQPRRGRCVSSRTQTPRRARRAQCDAPRTLRRADGSQLSALSFQLSAFSSQLSALSYRLSALSFRLSAFGFQLSAFSYRLSAISYQLTAISSRADGFTLRHKGHEENTKATRRAFDLRADSLSGGTSTMV